jgi:hypothetical protein
MCVCVCVLALLRWWWWWVGGWGVCIGVTRRTTVSVAVEADVGKLGASDEAWLDVGHTHALALQIRA